VCVCVCVYAKLPGLRTFRSIRPRVIHVPCECNVAPASGACRGKLDRCVFNVFSYMRGGLGLIPMHLLSDLGSESSNVCVRVGIGKSTFLQKPDEYCVYVSVCVS
jgi:hypothetical protein